MSMEIPGFGQDNGSTINSTPLLEQDMNATDEELLAILRLTQSSLTEISDRLSQSGITLESEEELILVRKNEDPQRVIAATLATFGSQHHITLLEALDINVTDYGRLEPINTVGRTYLDYCDDSLVNIDTMRKKVAMIVHTPTFITGSGIELSPTTRFGWPARGDRKAEFQFGINPLEEASRLIKELPNATPLGILNRSTNTYIQLPK